MTMPDTDPTKCDCECCVIHQKNAAAMNAAARVLEARLLKLVADVSEDDLEPHTFEEHTVVTDVDGQKGTAEFQLAYRQGVWRVVVVEGADRTTTAPFFATSRDLNDASPLLIAWFVDHFGELFRTLFCAVHETEAPQDAAPTAPVVDVGSRPRASEEA
jgi:hypothetical protein